MPTQPTILYTVETVENLGGVSTRGLDRDYRGQ